MYDIAVDPIEGTTPTAKGGYEAMSVIALAHRNCLFSSEVFYMNKLAVGPEIAGWDISVTDPIYKIVEQVCSATSKTRDKVTFCVLDRPRHEKLISEIRQYGCRIRLISGSDCRFGRYVTVPCQRAALAVQALALAGHRRA